MKKIALINGSPKTKDSASGCVLEALKRNLIDNTITEFSFRNPEIKDLETICENEVWVFAFPLYVDGVPSHLLSCLYQLEQYLKDKNADICVYAIVNCGFYEGLQNANALDIIENWCIKSKIRWGQGIGIGSGGMLSMINGKSSENGPMKSIMVAIRQMSIQILKKESAKNLYVNANFPRILYKMAAEMGWRQQIKANGLKRKDLFRHK